MARRKLAENSVLVVATKRVGFFKAMKVMLFIACWGMVYEDLGRVPESVEEYASWWRSSVPTGYREQKLFREAFPSEATPTRMWEHARSLVETGDEDRTAAALGSLPLSALGIAGL